MQIGDVVFLNSGSPAMTVIGTSSDSGNPLFEVQWFVRDGVFAKAKFPGACLKKEAHPVNKQECASAAMHVGECQDPRV